MSRRGKRSRKPGARPAGGKGAPPRKAPARAAWSRRSVFRAARNWGIAGGVLLAGGGAVADLVASHIELHDLGVVGNGTPTVVQIHDPQCPQCVRLQNEMLEAAEGFADDELQVRVANIMTPEGRAMADRYGVSHVTLLLFDPEGALVRILRGPNQSRTLRAEFAALTRTGASPSG